MDVAGLSPESGARSSVTRRPGAVRDRRRRRSHATVRAEAARRSQVPSRRAPAVERAAGALAEAAPETADRLQAEYFVRLLTGRRGLIDQRIDEYQRKIAAAEAKGDDADAVADIRRRVRVADQDRETLDVLIDKLRLRFVRPAPA